MGLEIIGAGNGSNNNKCRSNEIHEIPLIFFAVYLAEGSWLEHIMTTPIVNWKEKKIVQVPN